jgi:hypothetical protein
LEEAIGHPHNVVVKMMMKLRMIMPMLASHSFMENHNVVGLGKFSCAFF